MFFRNDLITDRHAHAGSLANGFCGEEGVKNQGLDVRRNDSTSIGDRDLEPICINDRGLNGNPMGRLCRQGLTPHLVFDGIDRVGQNIHKYLI
jgi:hypothetical protein